MRLISKAKWLINFRAGIWISSKCLNAHIGAESAHMRLISKAKWLINFLEQESGFPVNV
jgi:hypothetical protein